MISFCIVAPARRTSTTCIVRHVLTDKTCQEEVVQVNKLRETFCFAIDRGQYKNEEDNCKSDITTSASIPREVTAIVVVKMLSSSIAIDVKLLRLIVS